MQEIMKAILDLLNAYTLPAVLVACGTAGYVIKEYVPMENKHIPLIMVTLGIIFNVAINGYIAFETTIIAGAVSGLASTGAHQVFVQYFKKSEEGDN